MRFNFVKSVQGASHLRKEEHEENKALGRLFPCQDKSFSEYFSADDSHKTPYYLTVVCDGHGGAAYFRSEKGAELAIALMKKILPDRIDKIVETLKQAYDDDGGYGQSDPNCHSEFVSESIRSLVPPLLNEWKNAVDSDLAENPITEDEYKFLEIDDKEAAALYKAGEELRSIYGATFLCFVSATLTDVFPLTPVENSGNALWFALQIGDGDIAVHTENGFFMPVPEDDRNFLNQTTSLCDRDAQNEFRIAFGTHKIDAVLCSTDGIANSFANEEQLFSFYNKVLTLFRTYSFENVSEEDSGDLKKQAALAVKEIETSLPDISKRGSGDDLTLAGFVDIDEEKFKKHIEAKGLIERGKFYQSMPLGGSLLAEKKFMEAAQNGYPEGYYQLGLMLVKKSKAEAIECFSKAAEAGVKEANEPLAKLLYAEALSLQKDGKHAEAFNDFLKSAEFGVKEAQFAVSLYFGRPQDYENCGVRQNFAKAIEWTLAAARQGHPDAECKMGKCYRDGRGVQQNTELSLEWYKKACDHGSSEAQEYLKQIGVL